MCAIGCLMVDPSESLDLIFDALCIPFTLIFDLIEGFRVKNDFTIGLTFDLSLHDSLQLSISIYIHLAFYQKLCICVDFILSKRL